MSFTYNIKGIPCYNNKQTKLNNAVSYHEKAARFDKELDFHDTTLLSFLAIVTML